MAFISLAIEKGLLTVQKTQLEFESMIIAEELNNNTSKMQDMHEESDDGEDVTDTVAYKILEMEDKRYNSQKESIEAQLKTINAQLESYEKAITTNIKNECKFSISV